MTLSIVPGEDPESLWNGLSAVRHRDSRVRGNDSRRLSPFPLPRSQHRRQIAAGVAALHQGHVFRCAFGYDFAAAVAARSEEHTSELQSLMRISYAVFCLTKKN